MRTFVPMPPKPDRGSAATTPGRVATTPRPRTLAHPQGQAYLARRADPAPTLASREAWREATSGSGAPLPHRGTMEKLFGRTFSRVKAFFDRDKALDALGANAATDGERVAFASHSPTPRQVGHELAHVVQMGRGGGPANGSRLSDPGGPAEREADRAAARAGRGEPVSIAESAPAALHRDLKSPKLEVPDGYFRIDMAKKEVAGGKSGEEGYIHYEPKPTAPDSTSIRLTQIVEDQEMTTGTDPHWENFNWAGSVKADLGKMQTAARSRVHKTIAGQTLAAISMQHFGTENEVERIRTDNEQLIKSVAPDALTKADAPLPAGLALQICDSEQAGFFVDHSPDLPDAVPRKAAKDALVSQDYMRPKSDFMKPPNQHGKKKKGETPTEAVIYDFPGIMGARKFMWKFETVARSDDIGRYYGTLWWQFEVDATGPAPKVSNEFYGIKPGVSDTFRSAVVEFNRFYANPHTVMKGQTLYEISRLYFGNTDRADDIFRANEKLIGKRDGPLEIGWRLRIPDVTDTLKKP